MKALVVISACISAIAGMPHYYPYGYTGYHAVDPYAAVAPIVGPTSYDYNIIPDTAPVPAPLPAHYAYAPAVAPTEYKNQYHSQDEFGQYAYGHASLGQVHNAVRDFTGAVRGSYSYIDANNEEVIVHYIADQGGFRVSSNALPVAPTFDGAAPEAPEANLEALVFDLEAPVFDLEPAVETPEVAAARAEHFRLVEEHKAAVAAALAAAEEEAVTVEAVVEDTTDAAVAEEEVVVEQAEEVVVEPSVAEEEEEVAEIAAAEEVVDEPTMAEEEEVAAVVAEAAVAEEETVPEAADAETVTEAAEAETETEATVAEETVERRKRQIVSAFPTYYSALPVEPVVVKAEAAHVPVAQAVRDAELLRIVHNPGHGVSYRVD